MCVRYNHYKLSENAPKIILYNYIGRVSINVFILCLIFHTMRLAIYMFYNNVLFFNNRLISTFDELMLINTINFCHIFLNDIHRS